MSKELEALRKIGLMTTKRNLQDFPIGNQPKQIVKMKIKEMPEFQEVVNALTELERLKKFKETFDKYELAKKQDFIAYENWLECEKELEELKQEVIARQETENSLTQWVADLTTELTELKSWRDELSGTIKDLISKAKHWEEKENKTDFEKGIARGYKTMLHQLLVGIDFDKELEDE